MLFLLIPYFYPITSQIRETTHLKAQQQKPDNTNKQNQALNLRQTLTPKLQT